MNTPLERARDTFMEWFLQLAVVVIVTSGLVGIVILTILLYRVSKI